MTTECLFRSTLLISVGKAHAGLITTVLAPEIRSLRGVRHIDAVAFRAWWEDTESARAVWEPYGVLVVVESSDDSDLRQIVQAVLKRAVDVFRGHAASSGDPQTLELNSIDMW